MYKIKELVAKLQEQDSQILIKMQIYDLLDDNGEKLTDETIDNILAFYIDSHYCENIDDLCSVVYNYCEEFNVGCNDIDFKKLRDYENKVVENSCWGSKNEK